MATVHITTNITPEQLLDAAAQLSTPELEKLADSIGQVLANRVDAQMTTQQTELSQASAINPLDNLSSLNASEGVSAPDVSDSDNGNSLAGVSFPIVKTLIPDSLTLDGDNLDL